jgi:hypothetical protein
MGGITTEGSKEQAQHGCLVGALDAQFLTHWSLNPQQEKLTGFPAGREERNALATPLLRQTEPEADRGS